MRRKNYICKKCGDIFPDRDYKHYAVCQDTNIIDPEEVLDSFETYTYSVPDEGLCMGTTGRLASDRAGSDSP